jgi:hypothetical protein
MRYELAQNDDADFGTLTIYLGKDDSAQANIADGTIELPLYASEAKELRAALLTLSETPEL